MIGKLRALELRVVQTSFLCPVQSSICLERANAAEIFLQYPGRAVWQRLTPMLPGENWKPVIVLMQEKPCRATTVDFVVGGCGLRPQLCWQFVQTCLTGRFAFVVLPTCLSMMSICSWTISKNRLLHVFFPSCTRFPCGVKREKCNLGEKKKVCVEKATNPTISVLHGKKHTGLILFLLCFGFKKTLHLSLFGPATTWILHRVLA